MLPEARVTHRSKDRLRLRIPAMRGDAAYFRRVGQELASHWTEGRLEVNPGTGSVLFLGAGSDPDLVARIGRESDLFGLRTEVTLPVPLSRKVAEPIQSLSSKVRTYSGGQLDLPGVAFMLLLGFGLFQIMRGDLRSPPWYTAFWYAFGVFSKSLADMASSKEDDS